MRQPIRSQIFRPILLLCIWVSAALLLGACGQLEFSGGPLLYDVLFSKDAITPNADGDNDATEIKYSLRRPANVTISFEDAQGKSYYFRESRRRAEGDYNVLWGGVVDEPQTIETSYGPVEVLSRVLPDGVYKWTIQAADDAGQSTSVSGQITLKDGDTELPELHNFVVVPDTFRPNQDGLRDDWVSISYYLNKDVDSATLFLEDPDNPARAPLLPKHQASPSLTTAATMNIVMKAGSISTPNRRRRHLQYRRQGAR